MRKANKSDKDKVVKIICESFNKNPHLNYIVKSDRKRNKRMAYLAEYAFNMGLKRDGVYLSDDERGVAIVYQNSKVKPNFSNCLSQLKLGFKVFSPFRIVSICKLESRIKFNRESEGDFLYCWFLGVENSALGTHTAWELMKNIFELSEKCNLPIQVETSLKRNNIIYQRFGFENYNILRTHKGDLTFWFMKRPVMPKAS